MNEVFPIAHQVQPQARLRSRGLCLPQSLFSALLFLSVFCLLSQLWADSSLCSLTLPSSSLFMQLLQTRRFYSCGCSEMGDTSPDCSGRGAEQKRTGGPQPHTSQDEEGVQAGNTIENAEAAQAETPLPMGLPSCPCPACSLRADVCECRGDP